MFQSTPPRGGRPMGDKDGSGRPCFNPRPRVGGDAVTPAAAFALSGFNPRPRVGGDRIRRSCPLAMPMFQSTPPRGGRRHPLFLIPQKDRVSIHAPAWGATIFPRANEQLLCVSIHAPAWGATKIRIPGAGPTVFQSTPPRGGRPPALVNVRPAWSFNPRPRVGGDVARELDEQALWLFQSTPPRGGRLHFPCAPAGPVCFNPRPRVGGDA